MPQLPKSQHDYTALLAASLTFRNPRGNFLHVKHFDVQSMTNPARLAALEKTGQQTVLLNEGQAAALLGIGRRKFAYIRQEPWFVAVCTAVELGPRALRWHRDELVAAAKNAPRVVKKAEPEKLAASRATRAAA
jgi:hypothetical protein